MKKYFELIKNYKLGFLIKAGVREIKRKIWREVVKNSYSQNYEDLIIDKFFDKKYRGRYLEIGAYHPTRLSNTYRFYKKAWQGTVIEPNPEIKNIFYKIRPRDKFFNIGISDKNSDLDYYQFLIPALNTFSKKEAEKNIKNGHKLHGIIKIETKRIENIVDKKIDYLSIDTEGFDEMILRDWPWKKYCPKVICVEDESEKIKCILKNNGYVLKGKTKSNLIFVKSIEKTEI